jgi:hypothetical protein
LDALLIIALSGVSNLSFDLWGSFPFNSLLMALSIEIHPQSQLTSREKDASLGSQPKHRFTLAE